MKDDTTNQPPQQTNNWGDSPAPVIPSEQEPTTAPAPAEQPQPITQQQQPSSFQSPPPKKSTKKPLLAILIAVLVLLIGGGAAAYAFWYQDPDRVVGEALYNTLQSSDVQANTVITSDSKLMSYPINLSLKELKFDMAINDTMTMDMDTTVTVSVDGDDYAMGGVFRLADDKTMYVQLKGIQDAFESIANEAYGESFTLSEDISRQFSQVENTWIKITPDELTSQSEEFTCSLDAMKKIAADEEANTEMARIYREHQFIDVKEYIGSKNGNLGYKVAIDKPALEAFNEASKSSKATKELQKCSDSEDSTESNFDTDTIKENADGTTVDAVVWVSRFTHELRAVDYTITSKNQSTNEPIEMNGKTTFGYEPVTVELPTESIDLTTWQSRVEKLGDAIIEEMLEGLFTDNESLSAGTA